MTTSWRFGINDTGESEGPKNAGIASFTTDRIGGIVREIIQNSIDERVSKSDPVEVNFLVEHLPASNLDLPGLRRALSASVESYAIDDNRYKMQFSRGIITLDAALKGGQITALTATDKNTTGASDSKGQLDKWHGLTKSVGLSTKDSKDSGGSFGVGKHAPFTATDMRTVLYATAYREKGNQSLIHRRFTGKAILVSHTIDGQDYRASGWLGQNYSPICDADIPSEFRLESPGTRVSILGFDDSKASEWASEAKESLVRNFFHALVQGNLRVRIDDQTIEAANLEQITDEMGEDVRSMIAVSKSLPKETTEIDGIGQVKLRIIVDENGERSDKNVALVRGSGMMITNQLSNLRISPSRQMLNIPRTWYGFSAIVECLSHGERSLLREAEGPHHDKISSDNADDSDQKTVSKALRSLGAWIRESIEKYAKPPDPSTADNAEEMAEYLPLKGAGAGKPFEPGKGQFKITEPLQRPIAPSGLQIPGTRRRRTSVGTPGGNEPGTTHKQGKKKGKGKGKTTRTIQVAFHDIRRLPTTLSQWPDHSAAFTFEKPADPSKPISLYAVGEEGKDPKVELERAYIMGRKLKVKKGSIAEIPAAYLTGERVHIELKALRPISDKKLEIRFTDEV